MLSLIPIFISAGLSILHDIMVISLPIPILLKMKLNWRKKANVIGMFSVGLLVTICSLLRIPFVFKVYTNFKDPFSEFFLDGDDLLQADASVVQGPVALLSVLELGVGISCGCLPACRHLSVP